MELIDKVIKFSGKSVPLKLGCESGGKGLSICYAWYSRRSIPIGCSFKMPASSVHISG